MPLIEEGIEQSQKIAKYLNKVQNEYRIQKIISSDLIRAKQTADIINSELKLPIEYTEKLREMNNGELAGMLNSDAEKLYPGIYFNTLDMDEKYPNGESPREFYNRIKIDFEKLINDNQNLENLLLLTHSGVINIIYHIVKKLEWSNKEKHFKIENGSIHRIRIKNNRYSDIEELKVGD